MLISKRDGENYEMLDYYDAVYVIQFWAEFVDIYKSVLVNEKHMKII